MAFKENVWAREHNVSEAGRKHRALVVSRLGAVLSLALVLVVAAACGGAQDSGGGSGSGSGYGGGNGASGGTTSGASSQMYPDIQDAELESEGGGTYSLSVTVSSPYDSPERYANGWRVLAPDGTVLGKHELLHEHSETQPFTRTQTGLEIPEGTEKITVEGRDLENGYGGETVTIPVPDS